MPCLCSSVCFPFLLTSYALELHSSITCSITRFFRSLYVYCVVKMFNLDLYSRPVLSTFYFAEKQITFDYHSRPRDHFLRLSSKPYNCMSHLAYMQAVVGLVVKASTSRAEDPGFDSHLLCGNSSGSNHTSDFKIGSPEATLPGAQRYRVRATTGRPGVSICDRVR